MNGDLIYREILKAHLRAIVDYYEAEMKKAAEHEAWVHRYQCKAAKLATEDVIELADTLDAAGEWIPMAKRFPEESGRYLVTIYDGATTMATVARWLPRAKAWEMTGRRAHYYVTAWMPLPKPYEEESDEHTD